MKKTLLSIALVATGLVAFAQKPVAGDKTAETSLNFQVGSAGVSYGAPELRLRYFLSEGAAVRLRLNLGSSSTTTHVTDGLNPVVTTAEVKNNTGFTFGITPGFEKHFAGTDKLSPYVGAQLPISFTGAATTDVTNAATASPTSASVVSGDEYHSKTGSTFGIGLGLLIGADYYFTDAVYLGAEMGLGIFNMSSTGKGSVEVKTGGTTTTSDGTESSSFDLFGIMPSGGVRLGFKF